MRISVLKNITLAAALATAMAASAVPAKRGYRTFTQPDGTQVSLQLIGDEFGHYYVTTDNLPVLANGDSFYFAQIDQQGRAVASDILATNPADRSEQQISVLPKVDLSEMARAISTQQSRRQRPARVAPAAAASSNVSGVGLFEGSSFPVKGSTPALVILVQYSDVAFTLDDPHAYFSDMLHKEGFSEYGGTGCVYEYFVENSCGQFTPSFDLFGPVTLPNKRSYYGQNDSYGDDKHPEEMVIDACNALDSEIDFSHYDTDGDGYVDNVFVFYAGQGEASYGPKDSVWPHQWDLESAGTSLRLDGVKISRYACTNEWEDGIPDGIGTFIHEFSHVMGLPDLYNTESSSVYYTPCEWSVLDYGPYNNNGRTPPAYSAFERNALGWIELDVLDQTPRSVTLENILDSNKAFVIPTSKNTEFFLLENRQQKSWDTYIPGHGMLIWHVDYNASAWYNNAVNNNRTHQYVDIEEACGVADGSATNLPAYSWPGTKNKTSFTDTTTPNMKTWSGTALNTPLTAITEANGVISFDVCGGGASIATPEIIGATELASDYFVAQWQPVEGALDYKITVATYSETMTEFGTDENHFGEGVLSIPDNWAISRNSSYTSSGNYGASSPSYKMSEDGSYVRTPSYPSPINSISFWAKYNATGTAAANPLNIYAIEGNKETLLASYNDFSSKTGNTYELAIENSNVYQIKFVYDKTTTGTNLALDDIVINYGSDDSVILPDYNDVSTSGATSVKVDRLIDGISQYKFTVVAVGPEGESLPSKPYVVKLPDSSVDDITIPAADIRINGLEITLAGRPFTLIDIYGRTIAANVTSATAPSPGVYILNPANAPALKLLLK